MSASVSLGRMSTTRHAVIQGAGLVAMGFRQDRVTEVLAATGSTEAALEQLLKDSATGDQPRKAVRISGPRGFTSNPTKPREATSVRETSHRRAFHSGALTQNFPSIPRDQVDIVNVVNNHTTTHDCESKTCVAILESSCGIGR